VTLKAGSSCYKGKEDLFAPKPTNSRAWFIMYRAQVAKFFKPSIDAVLEAMKGIAGDLDPENTVIADTPSD
jgi:hypothetical protein